jgi:hypothetical protein
MKYFTCTDQAGRIVDMPTFQPMQKVELILLFSDQENDQPAKTRRPPEKLKGLLLEKGEIISSVPHEGCGIN